MTPQEVFDKVVAHLRNQKERCIDDGGRCLYRNKRGQKCAAGCLIHDDEYHISFEHCSIEEIIGSQYFHVPKSLVERLYPHLSLIQKLQRCHDQAREEFWESELKHIAAEFKLKYENP